MVLVVVVVVLVTMSVREASCPEMHAKTSFTLGKTMKQLWTNYKGCPDGGD